MNTIIFIIGFMSMTDLFCTMQWIYICPDMEANPLMRWLWLLDPFIFILFKIIMTFLFCIVAFRLKENKLMRRLIWLPFVVYAAVTFIHCI